MEDYFDNIGRQCIKKAKEGGVPKLFESGFMTNTIRGVIKHPVMEKEFAYTFFEDDSYVEVRRCIIIE
jgi:hypothetical protein